MNTPCHVTYAPHHPRFNEIKARHLSEMVMEVSRMTTDTAELTHHMIFNTETADCAVWEAVGAPIDFRKGLDDIQTERWIRDELKQHGPCSKTHRRSVDIEPWNTVYHEDHNPNITVLLDEPILDDLYPIENAPLSLLEGKTDHYAITHPSFIIKTKKGETYYKDCYGIMINQEAKKSVTCEHAEGYEMLESINAIMTHMDQNDKLDWVKENKSWIEIELDIYFK